MERHAALPHIENANRVMHVLRELVKQHVAEATAEHHSQHAVEQQVVQVARGPAELGPRPDAQAAQQQASDESNEVHEPVPADAYRA